MGAPLLEAFEDEGTGCEGGNFAEAFEDEDGNFAEALAEAATDEDGVGFEAGDVVFATVFCFVF